MALIEALDVSGNTVKENHHDKGRCGIESLVHIPVWALIQYDIARLALRFNNLPACRGLFQRPNARLKSREQRRAPA